MLWHHEYPPVYATVNVMWFIVKEYCAVNVKLMAGSHGFSMTPQEKGIKECCIKC